MLQFTYNLIAFRRYVCSRSCLRLSLSTQLQQFLQAHRLSCICVYRSAMLSPSGRSTYKMEPIPSHRAKAIFQEYLDRRTTEKRNRLQMAKRIMTWYSDLESEVSEHFDKALQSTVNKRPRLDTEEMQRCSIKPIHLDTSFSGKISHCIYIENYNVT